ncbi:MAG: hypothetical protein H6917_12715 [Novosphingobium sp.]|nr:hypothetical protein [Novosphingobium sp.]MCP5403232.1 hypothetical protein [Novosphingobium sp.]
MTKDRNDRCSKAERLKRKESTDESESDTYSNAETEARAKAALKRMLATPPKQHKDSKLGKR